MTQVDDLSRSLDAFDQNTSLVVVVEMSEASWLVAGLVPDVDRQPLKKLEPDPSALLLLLGGVSPNRRKFRHSPTSTIRWPSSSLGSQ